MPTFRAADGNIVNEGTSLQLTKSRLIPAELGDPGNIYEVVWILDDEENEFPIGIKSEEPIAGWHNLEGKVDDGHGYWIHVSYLNRYFIVYNSHMEVAEDFEFRKKNLKGKRCRIVTSLPTGDHIVEFDENVNGMGADGLGKQGHCVPISPNKLKAVKKGKELCQKRKNGKG